MIPLPLSSILGRDNLSFGKTVDPQGNKSAARESGEMTHGPDWRVVRAVDGAMILGTNLYPSAEVVMIKWTGSYRGELGAVQQASQRRYNGCPDALEGRECSHNEVMT